MGNGDRQREEPFTCYLGGDVGGRYVRLLQLAEALTALGFANDRRLKGVMDFIRSKQDEQGRWPLEYDYPGKTWLEFGKKKEPNKWVTLRALQVLRSANA